MRRPKRNFSDEVKRAAIDDYVSGRKSAAEVAASMNIAVGLLYKWRVSMTEATQEARLSELENDGSSPAEQARRILELEDELAEYQKKVGEQAVIIDLLKKLRQSKSFQSESELSGLIETTRSSNLKRKRWK